MKASTFLLFVAVMGCTADDVDDFLRYYALPVAAAAYSDAPSICFQSIANDVNSNIQIFGQDTFECDSLDDTCSGYTAFDSTNQFIIVSFRGTNKFLQLVDEGWDYDDFEPLIGGNVAEYFYNGFTDIWNHGMKNDFYQLKNKYPSYNILIVGHSLGGAMASIAAATIVSTGVVPASKVYLYTFGQPRTGNTDYAAAFNALGMSAYRVVHNRDMVAHLPPMILYDYYHHAEEIWYQNDMAVGDPYFMCNPYDGEDSSCSDSLTFTTSIDDHKHYFGVEVSNFGSNGCSNDGSKALKSAKTLSRPYRIQRMDKEKLAKKVLNAKKQSSLHKNKILH